MEDGRKEIGGEKKGTLNGGGQGESESERGRQREREQGGGCGFPSWLLLIFCKPQSASAISIHFLHLFPLHITPQTDTHMHTLLAQTPSSHSPSLHHHPSPATNLFCYLPACLSPIYSCCFISQHTRFLALPIAPYRPVISITHSCSLSLLSAAKHFFSRVKIWKRRRQ